MDTPNTKSDLTVLYKHIIKNQNEDLENVYKPSSREKIKNTSKAMKKVLIYILNFNILLQIS